MSRSRLVILYDDHCAFCRARMRTLARLDWLGRLEPRPASDPGEDVAALGVTPQALAGAIHCITPDGRVLCAARALRVIGARVPLLFPLALLLWMPGMLWVAEPAYRWVARHRHLFGPAAREKVEDVYCAVAVCRASHPEAGAAPDGSPARPVDDANAPKGPLRDS